MSEADLRADITELRREVRSLWRLVMSLYYGVGWAVLTGALAKGFHWL